MIINVMKYMIQLILVSLATYYLAYKFNKNVSIGDSLLISVISIIIMAFTEKFANRIEYIESFVEENEKQEEEEATKSSPKEAKAPVAPPVAPPAPPVPQAPQVAAPQAPQVAAPPATTSDKVVVAVDNSGKIVSEKIVPGTGAKTAVTKQQRSRLSMQEQKITDAIQKETKQKEISKFDKGDSRINKDYGYSFLPPSEWNLPLPEYRKCVPQKECPACPVSYISNGHYLGVQNSKQLPPQPLSS